MPYHAENPAFKKLLKLFVSRRGEWIALPSILKLGIAQYNARIAEMRSEGHAIENRTEYVNKVKNSWFVYLGGPGEARIKPKRETPIGAKFER
ncbi:MAG TPA: hypothetical protein VG345_16490 [Bryobacteraceae bacterium]|jgi:hypothetical protein|nr:hypothetical protein [Bryobacteraceae bacterium]